ncbi:unnamed protein product [Darwinula stevensoni]|uniref:Oplophorus-luciferin 2-monooxygenase non-catalytic subunit n=1 Tax=Darwinula stevensoni TaxID=69355 RepID=A0A7R9A6J1_9CRUS|nr:unnamed protein product [Darwinula stevensoni]CAG0889358.1 unnamed protein product [Darwinula stevensoni]
MGAVLIGGRIREVSPMPYSAVHRQANPYAWRGLRFWLGELIAWQRKRFIVLSLFFLLLPLIRPIIGQYPCPEPDDILPCTCSLQENGVYVECSEATSSDEIFFAFNNAVWPVTDLAHFQLANNHDVKEIPERMFGDVSFEVIETFDCGIRSIHPSALLPSIDRLKLISMSEGALEQFPWDYVRNCTQLTTIDVTFNSITVLPPVQSKSLEVLGLVANYIPTLETGSYMPKLKFLSFCVSPYTRIDLGNNPISELAEGTFRPIFEILTQGDGSIVLGTSVVCDCTIAWLVLNPGFLGIIEAYCADGGPPIQELNPGDFADCNAM